MKPFKREPTDLSSASLLGFGAVPGSRVIARKKLYTHNPRESAKSRWEKGCDSDSKIGSNQTRGVWGSIKGTDGVKDG